MRFQCPFCRTIVAVDNDDCGSEVQCGSCGEIVTVPPDRVATGAVISDFLILEELGRGGMGVVYLAYQMSLDRQAALKVLADQYANNADFVVGFIKEARAAAKLNHPHIVQAYAVGEDEGIFYFAMENVDGETMKNVLKRRKIIPVDEAVSIMQQIAEALDYAWKEQRLIHRDIKPDNIMITKNGRAKLADLGLARVASDLEDDDDEEVMGTPQYISPEHLTGAPMDVRSDIYSLGATFFHLITGRFPFEGRTATEIARKHLEAALQSPKEVNPDIPDAVCKIIQKMMAKNVKNRYQDAASLVEDLRRVRQGKSPASSMADSGKNVTQHVSKKKTGKVFKKTGRTSKIKTKSGTATQTQDDSSTTGSHLAESGSRTGPHGTGTASGTHSGTGTGSGTLDVEVERKPKPFPVGLVVGIVLIVFFVFAGTGGFLLWLFVFSEPGPKEPGNKGTTTTTTTPKKKPGKKIVKVSPFLKAIKDIQKYIKDKPGDKHGILEKCDMLYADFAVNIDSLPPMGNERAAFEKLKLVYVPLDEARLHDKRRQLHDEHIKKLGDLKWDYDQEQERIRKKEAAEKRAKDLEREKKEREERQAALREKRMADRKQQNAQLKASMRRRFVDYVLRKRYKSAKNVFEDAIRQLEIEESEDLMQQAEDMSQWGMKMAELVRDAENMEKKLLNCGTQLKGVNMTIKSPEGKTCAGMIDKIENGELYFEPFTYKKFKIPLTSLPEKEFATKVVKKLGQKLKKEEDAFKYLLANGYFLAAIKLAPDDEWKDEAKKTATEYFYFKLSQGSKEEKADLQKRYGKLPQYKAAKGMLEGNKKSSSEDDEPDEGGFGDDGDDFDP